MPVMDTPTVDDFRPHGNLNENDAWALANHFNDLLVEMRSEKGWRGRSWGRLPNAFNELIENEYSDIIKYCRTCGWVMPHR